MAQLIGTAYNEYKYDKNNTWRGPKGIVKKFGKSFHAFSLGMVELGVPRDTWEDAVQLCEAMGS